MRPTRSGHVDVDGVGRYSHDNFITSAEVPRIVDTFLADPMSAGEEHTT